MTDLEKIKKVLTEAKVPFNFSELSISFTVEKLPTDLSFSIDFDEDTGEFVGLDGKCWREHPTDFDPWDL